MSREHQNAEGNKAEQAFGGQRLPTFGAEKVAFLVDLGGSRQPIVGLPWFPGD